MDTVKAVKKTTKSSTRSRLTKSAWAKLRPAKVKWTAAEKKVDEMYTRLQQIFTRIDITVPTQELLLHSMTIRKKDLAHRTAEEKMFCEEADKFMLEKVITEEDAMSRLQQAVRNCSGYEMDLRERLIKLDEKISLLSSAATANVMKTRTKCNLQELREAINVSKKQQLCAQNILDTFEVVLNTPGQAVKHWAVPKKNFPPRFDSLFREFMIVTLKSALSSGKYASNKRRSRDELDVECCKIIIPRLKKEIEALDAHIQQIEEVINTDWQDEICERMLLYEELFWLRAQIKVVGVKKKNVKAELGMVQKYAELMYDACELMQKLTFVRATKGPCAR
eukprot:GEMP01035772.1.p1 GENE.GEMP01035772.1~~GEMP01035772.1.p1  ORF type:complete len:336 (+),score=60.23 GEMP01035772.1:71-1078(+)